MIMRFLCLHGIGSSAQVLETQLSALISELGPKYEFVFIQGDLPSAPGPGVEGLTAGPYYSFFTLPTPDQVRSVFGIIDQTLDAEGPFDGIIGFSQGASLAASYLLSYPFPELPVKCAVFFCASMPFDVDSSLFRALDDGSFRDEVTGEDISDEIRHEIPEIMNRTEYPGLEGKSLLRRYGIGNPTKIWIPTVHVYSSNDMYYVQSQGLARMCQSLDKEEIVHRGGHSIPWEQGLTTDIIERIKRMVHAADLA